MWFSKISVTEFLKLIPILPDMRKFCVNFFMPKGAMHLLRSTLMKDFRKLLFTEKINFKILLVIFLIIKRKIHRLTGSLALWVECSPGRPVSSSRLRHIKDSKKWYLIPPCLTLSIIRYISRVVEQSGEGVAPSLTPWCSSYWKGSLQVTLDYGHLLHSEMKVLCDRRKSSICLYIFCIRYSSVTKMNILSN